MIEGCRVFSDSNDQSHIKIGVALGCLILQDYVGCEGKTDRPRIVAPTRYFEHIFEYLLHLLLCFVVYDHRRFFHRFAMKNRNVLSGSWKAREGMGGAEGMPRRARTGRLRI